MLLAVDVLGAETQGAHQIRAADAPRDLLAKRAVERADLAELGLVRLVDDVLPELRRRRQARAAVLDWGGIDRYERRAQCFQIQSLAGLRRHGLCWCRGRWGRRGRRWGHRTGWGSRRGIHTRHMAEWVELIRSIARGHLRLHTLENAAERLASRGRERLVRNIHDSVRYRCNTVAEKAHNLIREVVAVVREQVVGGGRESRRDGRQKSLEFHLRLLGHTDRDHLTCQHRHGLTWWCDADAAAEKVLLSEDHDARVRNDVHLLPDDRHAHRPCHAIAQVVDVHLHWQGRHTCACFWKKAAGCGGWVAAGCGENFSVTVMWFLSFFNKAKKNASRSFVVEIDPHCLPPLFVLCGRGRRLMSRAVDCGVRRRSHVYTPNKTLHVYCMSIDSILSV